MSYEDLESIIDDEIDSEFAEISEIKSDWEADRLIGRIKKNKEEQKNIEARAKEVISNYKYRVELWKDNTIAGLNRQNEYMLRMLEDYYKKNSDGKSKMKFPNGNLGYYAVREKINWGDEKELLTFIQECKKNNASLPDTLLRFKPELEKDNIKKLIQFNEDGEATINGVILPEITREESHSVINVR